jgi:exodeoxyribonuclease VII large subunit
MHAASLRLLDPVTTMARGWSITRDGNGNVVRSTSDVKQGDTLVTLVADGSISSTVEGVN